MLGLIYTSKSYVNFSEAHMVDFANYCAERNQQAGISGYLCSFEDRFTQYIEGEAEAVWALMAKIEADDRHELIHHLTRDLAGKRLFPHWSMRSISDAELKWFQLETCLDYNLIHIKCNFPQKELRTQMVWEHVLSLSRKRNDLVSAKEA